jgi:segregation and condensation protein A
MTAIDIHLENFEGPLDLLMHLIRKNNLDIYDIPISNITAEYLQYLDVMKSLNLEVAGEFLVMAATLMQIKAKMLLPAPEVVDGENGPDPRGALVSMLEEYQRYKEASKEMNGRFSKFKDSFYRGSPVFTSEEKYLDLDFYALMDAVKRAFVRVEATREVEADQFPIESRVAKIEKMLEGREWMLLDDVFASETRRLGVITCFMALLELIKQRKIMVSQDEAYTEVRIYPAPPSREPAQAPEPAVVAAAAESPQAEPAAQEPAPAEPPQEPPPAQQN